MPSCSRSLSLSPWLELGAAVTLMLLTGCTHPIGAERTTPRIAYRQVTRSALDHRMGDTSRLVLHRYSLEDQFRRQPAEALNRLHELACLDDRRDPLFALAELNYLHAARLLRSVKAGEPRQARDYFLAAAIYGWFYLLGEGTEPPPSAFDRRFRVACDLYNRSVAAAFSVGTLTNATVRLTPGERVLGPGRVEIQFTKAGFNGDLEEIDRFLPADLYKVRGLTVRDRQSGLGAPLITAGKTLDEVRFARRFPATLVLRVPGDLEAWSRGELKPSLELYSPDEVTSIEVAGKTIPLECDLSAPLAYALNDSHIWKLGSAQFFSAEEKIKSNIYFTQPYRPGRVPVIFVHGTFSSPVWWAEMWNTLRADPRLRERFQFWNFVYNTGNPVTFSAANLRDAIERKVRQLDPDGKDPALRQMVVIGHSQGGLLARLTVTDTGDTLWRTVLDQDFDEVELKAEDRERLRRNLFFTPLPSVTRVVFVSTPHRGSYLAGGFVRSLARRFMSLPAEAVQLTGTLLQLQGVDPEPSRVRKLVPTSLDGMSPKSRSLIALSGIPLAPGVRSHSVIAVKGKGPHESGGDGVVKYRSAHLDYADSEFVVRSGHSCQDQPSVIEEVRRILIVHLAELPDAPSLTQSRAADQSSATPPGLGSGSH